MVCAACARHFRFYERHRYMLLAGVLQDAGSASFPSCAFLALYVQAQGSFAVHHTLPPSPYILLQAEWSLSEAAKEEVSKAGAVLLQREIPEHVNIEVAKVVYWVGCGYGAFKLTGKMLAKAANVPVYMDAGGMEGPLDPQILACLTLLSPNETELNRLTNMPTENEEQNSGAQGSLHQHSILSQKYQVVACKSGESCSDPNLHRLADPRSGFHMHIVISELYFARLCISALTASLLCACARVYGSLCVMVDQTLPGLYFPESNVSTANFQIEAAARMLQGMGVEAVLVKLGADGSLFLPGCYFEGLRIQLEGKSDAKKRMKDVECKPPSKLESFKMGWMRGCPMLHDCIQKRPFISYQSYGKGQAPIRQKAIKAEKVLDTTGKALAQILQSTLAAIWVLWKGSTCQPDRFAADKALERACSAVLQHGSLAKKESICPLLILAWEEQYRQVVIRVASG
eukprot:644449-Pelagomonas_calceolata.AAC.3